jgi:hypothetical protein
MIRTQISLEPEELSWLKRQAKNGGISRAGVIRQLIRNASDKTGNLPKPRTISRDGRNKIAARFAFVGCIKDGAESDAKLAEDYLYGEGGVR